jgi:hypothetical protein
MIRLVSLISTIAIRIQRYVSGTYAVSQSSGDCGPLGRIIGPMVGFTIRKTALLTGSALS